MCHVKRDYVCHNYDDRCSLTPAPLLPSNQDIQIHTIGVKSKFAIKAKSADLSSCPGHGVMESRC